MKNKEKHRPEQLASAETMLVAIEGVPKERRATLKTAICALISGIEIGERLKAEEIKRSIT